MTKLQEILEELADRVYAGVTPKIYNITQSSSAIKKLFLEWVGENLSLVNPPHGNIEWLKGYNQRGEEIRRKIK